MGPFFSNDSKRSNSMCWFCVSLERRGQGRIQPEVEERAIWRGGAKKKMKSSLVFLPNSASVYVFPRIQNETLKKECIWVRIRGAFLAKKGAPKLSFHREGGAVAPFAP